MKARAECFAYSYKILIYSFMQSYYEACKETEGVTFGLFYEVAIFACHLILLSTFNKKLTIGKPHASTKQTYPHFTLVLYRQQRKN